MYSYSKHNICNHKFGFATFFTATLAILTLLSGLLLFSPRVSADSSAVVDVAVDIPASCSIVASRESVSATIIPGNPGEIGDTTIKAVCNDPAGLAVYAVGYTNDTYGNNNLASTVGGTTINIPTAIASSPSTSQWNMTINAVTGTYTPTIPQDFENTAHIIPTQYTKVAYRNTTTDSGTNATGAQFTTTFDAYIANDQAAGTYTGKVKFLLIHPNVLTYDDQTGEPATFQPTTLDSDPEAPLPSMQNWSGCSTMSANETTNLVDTRDGNEYVVAKLGNQCWLTENLRLDFSSATFTSQSNAVLEAATNNPANGFIAAAKAATPSSIFTNNFEDIMFNTDNLTGQQNCPSGNCRTYGVYYNWYTATAGWGTDSTTEGYTAEGDICPAGWRLPISYYSTSNDFATLNSAINSGSTSSSTGLTASPANFVYSGYLNSGGIGSRGNNGHYWSSSRSGGNYAVALIIADNMVIDSGPGTRYDGSIVRCIAQ